MKKPASAGFFVDSPFQQPPSATATLPPEHEKTSAAVQIRAATPAELWIKISH
jgi:hypothetical protein